MKSNIALLSFFFCVFLSVNAQDQRPNILFLVIEDTSPYLLPAYGNTSIKTPNIDWLALNGVIFDNAFANAPHCSPARSTLISGTQATVYGNDIHRKGHVQKEPYFLVKKLKDNGYFTVNNNKMDYNITGKKTRALVDETWSVNSKIATYNHPDRGSKPFFGQFNNLSTHMSRITTITTDKRLDCKVDAKTVTLPPHVPDLPEMRADYALHLEGVQDIDQWVGIFIEDLKKRSLIDRTIIFFFSDHGGCLPRGKAYPFDTGHRVPLVVYAPEKYEHLLPASKGKRTDRMVSFDDFIPTAMSLAGIEIPKHVTGKAFMGQRKASPKQYIHTFRTNTGGHTDVSRGVYHKNFQYIKYYTPHKRHAMTQTFQWQMPAQLAWDKYYMSGKASSEHSRYYEPHPKEALYDLSQDPWQLQNLAENPKYRKKIDSLRAVNAAYIRDVKDLGFLSWEIRTQLANEGWDAYSWVRETEYPLNELIGLAEQASMGDPNHLPEFIMNLDNPRASFRFWALSGILNLTCNKKLKSIPSQVYDLMVDAEHRDIYPLAAEILVRMGESKKGLDFLMAHFDNPFVFSSLENLWELSAPLKEKIKMVSKNSSNPDIRVRARSLLIKLGVMDVSQLYEKEKIEAAHRTYLKRVSNFIPNTPNPGLNADKK